MGFLYQIGIHFFVLLLRIYSVFNQKIREGLDGRKNWSSALEDIPRNAEVIWFHCASLGEFDQGLPVMQALKKRMPNAFILVTFFSPSGMQNFEKRAHPVDKALYLPFDTKINALTFIQKAKPKLAVFVKYEFWPNFILECRASNVKLVSISTLLRKNQIYFKGYGRFFERILKNIDYFFVQNEETKTLLESIGVNNITLSGDTRYDRVLQHKEASVVTNSILSNFTSHGPILIAGSSWESEEKIIKQFLESNPQTKVIIAPHNIKRANIERIETLLNQPTTRYTGFNEAHVERVLILDTIGHLSSAYQHADYALIGGGFSGSLHNILEAAAFGLPVFFGPNHQKFPEAQIFIDGDIGFVVENAKQLSEKINALGNQDDLKQKIEAFMQSQSGATEKIVNHLFISKVLNQN
jgi:3-deoxy-D-manno-octulosonic-acid transferase